MRTTVGTSFSRLDYKVCRDPQADLPYLRLNKLSFHPELERASLAVSCLVCQGATWSWVPRPCYVIGAIPLTRLRPGVMAGQPLREKHSLHSSLSWGILGGKTPELV